MSDSNSNSSSESNSESINLFFIFLYRENIMKKLVAIVAVVCCTCIWFLSFAQDQNVIGNTGNLTTQMQAGMTMQINHHYLISILVFVIMDMKILQKMEC